MQALITSDDTFAVKSEHSFWLLELISFTKLRDSFAATWGGNFNAYHQVS